MTIRLHVAALVLAAAGFLASSAQATTNVTVQSTADIFLAGQSSLPSPDYPANPAGPATPGAGTLPNALSVSAGEILDFSATGTVSCCVGGSPTNGPDGGPSGYGPASIIPTSGFVNAYLASPGMALVGVFNTGADGWNIFIIGSSDTGVVVPVGATKLYLGVPDALGFNDPPGYYNDNTGSFQVSIAGLSAVPEASTWAMMLIGFLGLGSAVRLGRRAATSIA